MTNLFLYIVLVVLLIATVSLLVRLYKSHRFVWPHQRQSLPLNFRMLIALRKRTAGFELGLRLSEEVHNEITSNVSQQWQQLCAEWSALGRFTEIFRKSDQGLPAGRDDEWFLLAHLDIPDYSTYRNCVAVLEKPAYRDLRNLCEVRLILSDVPNLVNRDIGSYF